MTRGPKWAVPPSLRVLLRNKQFAVLAVLSLGVGIALNTTMYSVFDAVTNPKLNLPHPERLYEVRFFGYIRTVIPAQDAIAAYSTLTTVEGMTGVSWPWADHMAERGDRVRQVNTASVMPNYFAVVGSAPMAGRLLTDADLDVSPRPVMISEGLWKHFFPEQKLFAAEMITVGDQPRLVVGVLRNNADLPGFETSIWQLATRDELSRTWPFIARVRPGVSIGQLRAELEGLESRFVQAGSATGPHVGFRVLSLVHFPFRTTGFTWALIGSVAAVLLVACVNLASLQLARGIARTRELATRAAVGASRRQIITQLTTESAWLASGGLIVAALLTWWGMHLVEAYTPPMHGAFAFKTQFSWRVAIFAMLATVASLALIGLLPALRLSRVDLNELLKSGAGTGRAKSATRQYGALVVIEVALALLLLSGASLLVATAAEARSVAIHHDAGNVQTTIASVVRTTISDRSSRRAWSDRLVERITSVAGVTQAATLTAIEPATRSVSTDDPGGSAPVVHPAPDWRYYVVSPGAMRTLGIPIVRGRDFAPGEFAEPQVLVDEHTAACLWPGADPVGRLLKLDSANVSGPWLRVIGVAQNQRTWELRYRDRFVRQPGCPKPARLGHVYLLNAMDTAAIPVLDTVTRRQASERIQLVFRGRGDQTRLGIQVRRSLLALEGVRSVEYPEPWERVPGLAALRRTQDFVATLFSIFAALAAGLAALGVYAIVSFSVAQRTREFGVRIALGAAQRHIRDLVAREISVLTLLGILTGVLATWKSAGLLRSLLFSDWDRYDSRVFAVAAVLLFAASWLASWIPVRRAMRINPVEAMRND